MLNMPTLSISIRVRLVGVQVEGGSATFWLVEKFFFLVEQKKFNFSKRVQVEFSLTS